MYMGSKVFFIALGMAVTLSSFAAPPTIVRCSYRQTGYYKCSQNPNQLHKLCIRTYLVCPGSPDEFKGETCSNIHFGPHLQAADNECGIATSDHVDTPVAEIIDVPSLPVANPDLPTVKSHDFPNDEFEGPRPAHRHPNGGGIVSDDSVVDSTAYVGPDALVSGSVIGPLVILFGAAEVDKSSLADGFSTLGGRILMKNDRLLDRCSLDEAMPESVKTIHGKEIFLAKDCTK